MKKIVLEIKAMVELLLGTNDLKKIAQHQNRIKILAEEAFIETLENPTNSSLFKTSIHTFILEKVSNRVHELKDRLPPIRLINNNIQEKIIFSLKSLNEQLIRSYLVELNGLPEIEKYKKEQINSKNAVRDFLLNPNYSYEGDEYIEEIKYQYFKKIVDNGFEETKEFFKNLFDTNTDLENSKQQLALFVEEISNKIIRLSKTIISNKDSLNIVSINISHEEDINSLENDVWQIAELQNSLDNNEYLKQKLIKLRDYFFKAYPFLGNVVIGYNNRKTVFGDFNYKKLNKLFEEFSPLLGKETTKERFVEVFTSTGDYNETKINLINGTLGTFGYLIKEIYKYFDTSNFNSKKEYDQWWSDRFTFNISTKDVNSIGRIKSMNPNKYKGTVQQIIGILE